MRKWPGSGESNETGVNLTYGTEWPWFDFLQKNGELAKRYNLAMEAHGSREGFEVSGTVEGYPWDKLGEATVVDVSICVSWWRDLGWWLMCDRWVAIKATPPSPSPKSSRI